MSKFLANTYSNPFDSGVLKDVDKIDKEIDEELKKEESGEEIDREKLLNLRMQKLYRGMEINSGMYNKWNRLPY